MAKLTLLEMTQDVLNDISGDVITDITDTVEADQIVKLIKSTYYDLLVEHDEWRFADVYDQLTDGNSATYPTKFTIASTIVKIYNIWYNHKTSTDTNNIWTEIVYLSPVEFIQLSNNRSSGDTNVSSVDTGTGAVLNIVSDKMPQYWTSFDDSVIWMDSYDSAEETFLHGNLTNALMKDEPTWTESNSFTPTMPADLFPLLVNEVKSRASLKFKQAADQKAEAQARKLHRKSKISGTNVPNKNDFPNWGR